MSVINPSVLVVEDDRDIAETLKEVLDSEGYEVTLASDGLEALEYLAEAPPPAIILLDWTMPRCDGAGFLARRRGDPSLEKIPVVVFTADMQVHERARSLDGAWVLRKPVMLDDLLRLAARYCGPGRSSA